MGKILNKSGQELMINMKTGMLFTRELTKKEKAYIILNSEKNEVEKLNELQNLGYELEEIVELALDVS